MFLLKWTGSLQTCQDAEIIEKSLNNYGYILLVDSLDEAADTARDASEHLEIRRRIPLHDDKNRNAGASSLGSIPPSLWETILQVQTMCFRQMVRHDFSPR